MAAIPQAFAEQPESAIASYDYTDIAEGTGIVVLNLADNSSSGNLSSATTESHGKDSTGTSNPGAGHYGFKIKMTKSGRITDVTLNGSSGTDGTLRVLDKNNVVVFDGARADVDYFLIAGETYRIEKGHAGTGHVAVPYTYSFPVALTNGSILSGSAEGADNNATFYDIQSFEFQLVADNKLLTQQEPYSTTIEREFSSISGSEVLLGSDDYDLPSFNAPKTVNGKGFLNIPYYVKNSSSGTTTAFLSGSVIHYDGSTETNIATFKTPEISSNSTGRGIVSLSTLNFTKQGFKKGDILRLNVKCYGVSKLSSGTVVYGTDPKARTSSNLSGSELVSKAQIGIPFNLNL